MNHTEVLQEITEQIESAAIFAFPGSAAAFMEFEFPGEEEPKRVTFAVYGYTGKKAKKVMRTLGQDITTAIVKLHPEPVCVIWRRYPTLEEHDFGWKCTLRLAIIDKNCNQCKLDLPWVPDGDPIPKMPR